MGIARDTRAARIAAGLAAALLMVGCDSPTPGQPPTPSPTRTSGPAVQAIACTDPIWSGRGDTVNTRGSGVADVISITYQEDTMHWQGGSPDPDGLYFQKAGLAVRTGTQVEVAVPDSLRGQVQIGWSNTDEVKADAVRIGPCPGDDPSDDWVLYPGGFWLRQPACVPLEVTSDGRTTTVEVPVGAACP
ncbi:hypothetical protein [Arthrobacter sp.]|uniref:hypothetical protein n=1 Tax=Arthrobacter sp. TaxID=1667 RepID=UPI003A94D1B3